jgi:hypothetical protein
MSHYTRDALELRICRWILAMTPWQRLEFASESAGAIFQFRGENYGRDLPEPLATKKNENELRLMKVALEEQRRRHGIEPRVRPPRIDNEKN